jgi:hypothetical protein
MNGMVKPDSGLPSLICLKEIIFYILAAYSLLCKYRNYFSLLQLDPCKEALN